MPAPSNYENGRDRISKPKALVIGVGAESGLGGVVRVEC
jgi:hypothetical protein